LGGSKVICIKDYQNLTATDGEGNVTKLDMPATSNVLQWFTEDGTKVSVRPSGTEPKIKFYIEAPATMKCPNCYTSACEEGMSKVKAVCKDLGI
jgi:phosphoglucomutase